MVALESRFDGHRTAVGQVIIRVIHESAYHASTIRTFSMFSYVTYLNVFTHLLGSRFRLGITRFNAMQPTSGLLPVRYSRNSSSVPLSLVVGTTPDR